MQNRVRLGKLTIIISEGRNKKIELFRNDRPELRHLTLSFNNPSGEIDLHMTTNLPGNQKDRVPVAKIPELDFAKALGSFGAAFIAGIAQSAHKVRKIRPGWLGRKGYAIVYMDDQASDDFLNTIAPKRKVGKSKKWARIFDPEGFASYANWEELSKCVYYPSFLHEIAEMGHKDPIFAVRNFGRHKPSILPIGLVNQSSGKKCWIRLDKLARSIGAIGDGLVLSTLGQIVPPGVTAQIYDALQLNEV